VSGSIPLGYSTLSKLALLDLRSNTLSGTIPSSFALGAALTCVSGVPSSLHRAPLTLCVLCVLDQPAELVQQYV
jgi:hypothetical protein